MNRITLLLLFAVSISFGQQKKEYYFDDDFKFISQKDFNSKIDYRVNLNYRIENDTAIFSKLILRNVYGKLDNKTLNSIGKYLENISKKPLDTTKIIVINYYPGGEEKDRHGEKSHAYLYNKDYLKKLHKIAKVEQFWIYKDSINLEHHHKKRYDWIHDRDQIIENTLFPLYFNFGSFAIIHPNGNYYIYYGEYGKTTVWEALEKMVKDNKL